MELCVFTYHKKVVSCVIVKCAKSAEIKISHQFGTKIEKIFLGLIISPISQSGWQNQFKQKKHESVHIFKGTISPINLPENDIKG
jgi:hypothetical protein